MSGDIERYEERDAWIPVRQDIGELAKQLAGTPFVGPFRGKPAEVFGAILYGHELHLAPLQALQALDSIDGRPTLKAEALRALFFRDGHRLEVIAWDDKKCTVRAERRDGLSSVEVTYTIGDAQIAGLANKRNWRTSPKSMLYARATAMAIKAVAPDIALGIDLSDDVVQQPPSRSATTVVQVEQMPPTRVVDAAVAPEAPDPAPASTPAMNALRAVLPEAADIIEGTIEPDPEPERRMITRPQLRKIGALIGDLERQEGRKIDRDERRWLIADMAGIADPGSLASANDLTAEQASAAIDTLTARLTVEDPPVEPVADADGVIA